ncbi:hypothetical protein GQ55_3G321100 [Panicum hallii var. hallii]|uniref:Uncharacterized protein n=1 Tax=Panicum hallii var. hallii TaxID=1504633 RepID=A0A2T7EFD6_9POAL|nr:hypothetical protein GQ55_3G321100 [Panicum hallii var. hallii]
MLQYMSAYNNTYANQIYVDARTMHQNFFVDILEHEANAYRKLLPKNVKDYLSRITGKDIK